MKHLKRCLVALVYLLPGVLYLSYHPIIRLGETRSMNLELSLPLIWLVIFDLVACWSLLCLGHQAKTSSSETTSQRTNRAHRERTGWRLSLPGISDRKFFLFALFPLYATLSIFWSANPTRAVLTAGIIWLIFFAVFSFVYILPLIGLPKNFRRNLLRSFFFATVIICFICWLQCLLDLASIGRETTLLCAGCTYHTFGFPHPSGLAIEPQFMGNLLLAPTLTALYLLIFRAHSKRERRGLSVLTALFSATLFLTFSRGAIYAYALALLILLIFALRRRVLRASLIVVPATTFVVVLVVQGIFTVIGPTHGSFLDGVSRSVHQLSLGIIDFRPASTEFSAPAAPSVDADESTNTASAAADDPNPPAGQSIGLPNPAPQPVFDGYIAASTNIRLNLNALALRTWRQTPATVIFGVGLGGAGVAMHRFDPNCVASPKEIVQNEPLSLLLELGLIGLALVFLALWLAFRPRSDFWRQDALPLLFALVVAYFFTLQFFSGPANALQIYLLPPLLYRIFSPKTQKMLDASQQL